MVRLIPTLLLTIISLIPMPPNSGQGSCVNFQWRSSCGVPRYVPPPCRCTPATPKSAGLPPQSAKKTRRTFYGVPIVGKVPPPPPIEG